MSFDPFVRFVVSAAQAPEAQDRIQEIRVHGNHTTPAADILALSGLAVGDPATDARLDDAAARLRASGRFEAVELRRRLRSLADPADILVMVLVDEHPAVTPDDLTPGPLTRLGASVMWLPVLSHADGYGFTYGARISFAGSLGDSSRLSVPLTWGGERRAGLEAERAFGERAPVVRGGVSLYQRVNPHFDLPDRRQEARVDVEQPIAGWLRAGASASVAQVAFGPSYDARHSAAGWHVTIDTRIDPTFPRDAVHATAGWERLSFDVGGSEVRDDALALLAPSSSGRWTADLGGYVGVGGSAVLALRGRLVRAAQVLPAAEQTLVGGSGSIRGYRTGHRAGDRAATVSAELRLPLTSPLRVGRLGLKAFVDAGAAWSAGARLAEQRFDRGVGGGLFLGAGPLMADLDVAWPESGPPRVHFGLGVGF